MQRTFSWLCVCGSMRCGLPCPKSFHAVISGVCSISPADIEIVIIYFTYPSFRYSGVFLWSEFVALDVDNQSNFVSVVYFTHCLMTRRVVLSISCLCLLMHDSCLYFSVIAYAISVAVNTRSSMMLYLS